MKVQVFLTSKGKQIRLLSQNGLYYIKSKWIVLHDIHRKRKVRKLEETKE